METPTPWQTHERLTSYLRDQILTNERPPGTRLPSHNTLRTQFGAAPATIRKAISTLEQEGLAYPQQGKGVIVLPNRVHTMNTQNATQGLAHAWLAEVEAADQSGQIEPLDITLTPPPAHVRHTLALKPGSSTWLQVEALYAQRELRGVLHTYLPPTIGNKTELTDNKTISPIQTLHDLGYPAKRYVDRISTRWPTPEQAEILQPKTRDPILRTERVTYSNENEPVLLQVMALTGLRHQLEYYSA